ncbi:Aldose 1-epimerase [Rhizobium sp. EC-SD404]|nr:Aldose 1-epimerase [Rhizobium sp. EC-SD404]
MAVFGTMPDGQEVVGLDIQAGALKARILTHGARLQSLEMVGLDQSLVIGAPTLEPYLGSMAYFGAMVGRFANRIGNARFSIDGAPFATTPNFLDRHTLHGGSTGLHARIWNLADHSDRHVTLTIELPDGDEGFPGKMHIDTRYEVEAPSSLRVTTTARTNRATPCSITNHAYFRLGKGDIRQQMLTINAAHYLPVDADLIPTGDIAPVERTAFDFRQPRRIGEHRYDHNFCLGEHPAPLRLAAILEDPVAGIALHVSTTEPGLQFYDGENTQFSVDEAGTSLPSFAGLALETQAWPDAPNRPNFPDAILRPGDVYKNETHFEFRRFDK